jgi:molecular chaperone HtpG
MEVLGKNLYSTPTVAVRELVQNAHDACVRRKLEDPDAPSASIVVAARPGSHVVIVEDSGAGLTREEIERYLATVGSGYTKRLRDRDGRLIGQFGLGFLTSFIVSERVDVYTTSYQTPGEGWHFSSKTGEQYAIEPVDPRPVGMRVELQLSSRFSDLSDPDVLLRLLEHYCMLLSIPVYADEARTIQVNSEAPPWRVPELSPLRKKKLSLELAQKFEPVFEPICTFDLIDGPARGILWIQDGSTFATSDNRNVAVFVRGMLVSRDERELVPTWGGFVGGVIESEVLSPTASREDLQKDEVYGAIADQVQEALVDGLSEIATNEPETWRRILLRHNEALLGAALCDLDLFELLQDELKVPTSEGDLTMREVAKRSEDRIYVSIGEKGSFEETLFRALSKPVVIGTRYAAFPFASRWADRRGIPVVRLGTAEGNRALFEKAQLGKEEREALERLLLDEDQELVPSLFDPPSLPLVLMPDREAQLKARLEADEADRRIGSAVLGLARLYTDTIEDRAQARLYVNVGAPVIRKMLAAQGEKQAAAGALLKALARLMASHSDEASAEKLSDTLESFMLGVEHLLEA